MWLTMFIPNLIYMYLLIPIYEVAYMLAGWVCSIIWIIPKWIYFNIIRLILEFILWI